MISILIAAYNEQDRIEECLDSIYSQNYYLNNKPSVYIGIDNCEKTKEKLLQIKHKYDELHILFFTERIYKYTIINTLSNITTKPNIIFFDADDIMLPNFIEKHLHILNNNNNNNNKNIMTISKCETFTNDINIRSKFFLEYPHGIFGINKEFFLDIGGFSPWRCGADTEFLERSGRNNIQCHYINEILFLVRKHNDSLTQANETKLDSKIRNWAFSEKNKMCSQNIKKIDCIISNKYEIIK